MGDQEEPCKTSNRFRWTGDDDAHLRRLWQGNLTVEAIAQEFQRTPASIYGRVRNLDLSSSTPTANSEASSGIDADAPKFNGPHNSKQ